MKHILKFNTLAEREAYKFNARNTPNVNLCVEDNSINYIDKIPVIITTMQLRNGTEPDPSKIITLVDNNRGAIDWIRENSHCYVVQPNSTGTHINIKQLDDTTRLKYADGTDSSEDIKFWDVFMKLPQFWWKCEENTPGSELWNISFSPDEQEGWHEWEGDTFIGVYKAHNDANGCPCSVSGQPMTVNVSQNDFKTGCTKKGDNYHLVSYEAHKIMCLLFYAYYQNTNSQVICGSGYNPNYITGDSDTIGMKDTPASGKNFVNFWGLEQWWGAKSEFIDNLIVTKAGVIGVKELGTSSTVTDIVRTINGTTNANTIKMFTLNEYGDLIPKIVTSSANNNTYFSDYGGIHSVNNVGYRSGINNISNGGIAIFDTNARFNTSKDAVSSRLLYKGDYTIVN